MSEAPERMEIWRHHGCMVAEEVSNTTDASNFPKTPYIRADLVPQWQPIETAPKDREILLWWEGRPALGKWWVPYDGHSGEWIDWLEDAGVSHDVEPTHWMPLPGRPVLDSVHGDA